MTSDATTLALLSNLVTKIDSIDTAVKSLKEGLSAIPFLSVGHQKPVSSVRELPTFISHEIRANAQASTLFLKILHTVGPYIGRNFTIDEKNDPVIGRYDGWRWHHLYHALRNLGIITETTSHSDFAKFIASILPDKKAASVRRGIYRTFDNDRTIIADIEDTFRPVPNLLRAALKFL